MAAIYDIDVGGGTADCFAAATSAGAGGDLAPLERTPGEDARQTARSEAVEGKRTYRGVIARENLEAEPLRDRNAGFHSPRHV